MEKFHKEIDAKCLINRETLSREKRVPARWVQWVQCQENYIFSKILVSIPGTVMNIVSFSIESHCLNQKNLWKNLIHASHWK